MLFYRLFFLLLIYLLQGCASTQLSQASSQYTPSDSQPASVIQPLKKQDSLTLVGKFQPRVDTLLSLHPHQHETRYSPSVQLRFTDEGCSGGHRLVITYPDHSKSGTLSYRYVDQEIPWNSEVQFGVDWDTEHIRINIHGETHSIPQHHAITSAVISTPGAIKVIP